MEIEAKAVFAYLCLCVCIFVYMCFCIGEFVFVHLHICVILCMEVRTVVKMRKEAKLCGGYTSCHQKLVPLLKWPKLLDY